MIQLCRIQGRDMEDDPVVIEHADPFVAASLFLERHTTVTVEVTGPDDSVSLFRFPAVIGGRTRTAHVAESLATERDVCRSLLKE